MNQTLADARELFRQEAYPEALQVCKTLLSHRGPHASVLTLEALIHQQSGNLEEAGKSIEKALLETPDHAGMLYTAALINRRLKNYGTAKNQAMKAIREAPDNPQVICQCAVILGTLREPKFALQTLETFTQKNKNHPEAWYLIGKFQKDLHNEEAAEFALKKCLTLQPDHPKATALLET